MKEKSKLHKILIYLFYPSKVDFCGHLCKNARHNFFSGWQCSHSEARFDNINCGRKHLDQFSFFERLKKWYVATW